MTSKRTNRERAGFEDEEMNGVMIGNGSHGRNGRQEKNGKHKKHKRNGAHNGERNGEVLGTGKRNGQRFSNGHVNGVANGAKNGKAEKEKAKEGDKEGRQEKMENAIRALLECVGEDPTREGLIRTPARFASALLFFTKGYAQTLSEVVSTGVFEENHNEMVIVKDINFHSLCEHHMVPFVGKVHIGYIPSSKILGLSKLARIVDMFARRLQVQERLTTQVCEGIVEVLQPRGVGVVVESQHMCMVMRGVQKEGALTITSSVRGVFKRDSRTRQEFFSLVNARKSC